MNNKVLFLGVALIGKLHVVGALQCSSSITQGIEKKLTALQAEQAHTYAYLLFHCIRFKNKEWPIPSSWYNNHRKVLRDYGLLEKSVAQTRAEEPVLQEVIAIFRSTEATFSLRVLERLAELLPSIYNWLIFDKLPIDKG